MLRSSQEQRAQAGRRLAHVERANRRLRYMNMEARGVRYDEDSVPIFPYPTPGIRDADLQDAIKLLIVGSHG